jgi:hypothetical protein
VLKNAPSPHKLNHSSSVLSLFLISFPLFIEKYQLIKYQIYTLYFYTHHETCIHSMFMWFRSQIIKLANIRKCNLGQNSKVENYESIQINIIA